MTKHTQGPWRRQVVGDVASITAASESASWLGVLVATVPRASVGYQPVSETERDANARLVAAAPDMLAALKRLAACPDLKADLMSPETLKALDDAHDAIAVAEG